MLDFPEINCNRCTDNLRVDGEQPECDGCEFKEITEADQLALAIYDVACPWGELDFKGVELAFEAFGVRRSERRKYLDKLVTIHRLVKEHHATHQRD